MLLFFLIKLFDVNCFRPAKASDEDSIWWPILLTVVRLKKTTTASKVILERSSYKKGQIRSTKVFYRRRSKKEIRTMKTSETIIKVEETN